MFTLLTGTILALINFQCLFLSDESRQDFKMVHMVYTIKGSYFKCLNTETNLKNHTVNKHDDAESHKKAP